MAFSEHKWEKTDKVRWRNGNKTYNVTQTSFDETTGTGTYNIIYNNNIKFILRLKRK